MKLLGLWGIAMLCVLGIDTYLVLANGPRANFILKNAEFCEGFLKEPKKLADFPFVKISNFNVRNLFISDRSQEIQKPEKMPNKRFLKPQKELFGVANAILRQLPHIIVLEEIDRDGQSLQVFAENHLNGWYKYIIAPSPDQRGITNAFLIRKDFPIDYQLISHNSEQWNDPTQDNRTDTLFRRDLPLLAIYPKGELNLDKAPLMGIFAVHFKSKRNRDGDEEGRMVRHAEASRTADIFRRYITKWGQNTCLMISGDFNGVVDNEDEFTEFRSLEVDNARAKLAIGGEGSLSRGTHMYMPKNGPFEVKELDYLFINKNLTGYLIGTVTDRFGVSHGNLRYKSLRSKIRKFPSDHFFISALLSMPEILQQYALSATSP